MSGQKESAFILKNEFDEPIVIPTWFNNLADLGLKVARWDKSKGNLVIALVAPAPDYAALAVAFGMTISLRKELIKVNSSVNIADIKQLSGRDVLFSNGKTKKIGKLVIDDSGRINVIGDKDGPVDAGTLVAIKPATAYGEIQKQRAQVDIDRKLGPISSKINSENTYDLVAETRFLLVGDRNRNIEQSSLLVGLKNDQMNFESLSTFIRQKDSKDNFGWNMETISTNDFLGIDSFFNSPDIISSGNRATAEILDANKVGIGNLICILSEGNELQTALAELSRLKRYWTDLDLKSFGWNPYPLFRGIACLDKKQ